MSLLEDYTTREFAAHFGVAKGTVSVSIPLITIFAFLDWNGQDFMDALLF